VMSATIKVDKKGQWQVSGDSPLAWLKEHYRQDLPAVGFSVNWPDPELQVKLLTAVPPMSGEPQEPQELPKACHFHPEAAPYQVSFPSQLATPSLETATHPQAEPPEDGNEARLRGEIMHRALDTWARGKPLPDKAALVAALRQGGLAATRADSLAPEIAAELQACRADPFLAALLAPDLVWGASEWLIEDHPQPGAIRRGVVDRLAFDGKEWWLLDFKTSRPAAGEDWDNFIAHETEKYRPQLKAYREMAARAQGLTAPGDIRVGIYFTACQRFMEV
jgi:ATP-dependent helicase/nuclease subunit A